MGDLAQVLVGRVSEGGGDSNAGIVYQNVDRTSFFFNLTNEGGDLRRIREVGGVGGALELGCERPNGVLGAGDERDRGSRRGEAMSKKTRRCLVTPR